jgi:hypothetical protein
MASAAAVGTGTVCCRATTRVAASELTALNALPGRVDAVLQSLTCELMAGHAGLHVAFTVAAHGGDQYVAVWSRAVSVYRYARADVRLPGCG